MVDKIHETVDAKALADHYLIRNGYVFLAITYPYNVFDALLIRYPQDAICFSPRLPFSTRNLDEHIMLINNLGIEKAMIIGSDIHFVKRCPSLKYLKIVPSEDSENCFNYSPLYDMQEIKSLQCATIYGAKEQFSTTIDYAKLNGLESFSVSNSGYLNYENCTSAKSLALANYGGSDIHNAFSSLWLDTLSLIQCKIKCLDGIEKSRNMQCLYLYHNRSLQDISAVKRVGKTLRTLRIKNCPQINDFSVLGELENLELLELTGNNVLPSLSFLKTMKNLKTFIFSMNVKDGDLSPCINLSYVYSAKDRKHYNFKDTDLPKGEYVHGNENIEAWRRLE